MQRQYFVLAIYLAVTGPVLAGNHLSQSSGNGVPGVPQNFQEHCARQQQLPGEWQERFDLELGKAKNFIRDGNFRDAEASLSIAASRMYQRGGVAMEWFSIPIGPKCLGENVARDWHETALALDRQRIRGNDIGRAQRPYYVLAADQGSAAVVAEIEKLRPKRFVGSLDALQEIVSGMRFQADYGAFLLPTEQRVEAAVNAAIKELKAIARRKQQEELATEASVFNRSGNAQQVEQALNLQEFGEAMTGIRMESGLDRTALEMTARADESMNHLRNARDWSLTETKQNVANRATERGDKLMAMADDSSIPIMARDQYYETAISYYNLGDLDSKANNARNKRQAIQGAVETEQQRIAAANEKASQSAQTKAEEMRDAVEKMQKTDAEKQSFKDEAAALEAELGF